MKTDTCLSPVLQPSLAPASDNLAFSLYGYTNSGNFIWIESHSTQSLVPGLLQCFVNLCVCACSIASAWTWRSEANFQETVFSFHHVYVLIFVWTLFTPFWGMGLRVVFLGHGVILCLVCWNSEVLPQSYSILHLPSQRPPLYIVYCVECGLF